MAISNNQSYTYSVTDPLDTGYTLTYGNVPYTIGTGSSSINWSSTNISVNPNLTGQTLHVEGNANITGELKVQGVALSERLDKIEERLGILHPNEELEEKWEQLRGLRKMYMELEAEIKEKEKMWAILKK